MIVKSPLRYRLIVDGFTTSIQYTLDQVASEIADAHDAGSKWDARAVTKGERYRLLTASESREVVAAVTARLTERNA